MMRFELNQYHRNTPDDELLADLRRTALFLRKSTVTRKEQNSHGRFHSSTLYARFGSWPDTLKRAGLQQTRSRLNVPEPELISDVRRVASLLGRESVTMKEQDNYGKFNSSTLVHRFGSWAKFLDRVGLDQTRSPLNISQDQLLENLEEVWIRLGRQPRNQEMGKPLSKYSAGTYARRFGSWRKALEIFVATVSEQGLSASCGAVSIPTEEAEFSTRHGRLVCESARQAVTQGTRSISWRLRFVVMRRDNFKCKVCGRTPASDPEITLDIDHVNPWSKGGKTVVDNLQTLCTKCNVGKSDLEFLNPLEEANHV